MEVLPPQHEAMLSAKTIAISTVRIFSKIP
jgi:hypothetical protein